MHRRLVGLAVGVAVAGAAMLPLTASAHALPERRACRGNGRPAGTHLRGHHLRREPGSATLEHHRHRRDGARCRRRPDGGGAREATGARGPGEVPRQGCVHGHLADRLSGRWTPRRRVVRLRGRRQPGQRARSTAGRRGGAERRRRPRAPRAVRRPRRHARRGGARPCRVRGADADHAARYRGERRCHRHRHRRRGGGPGDGVRGHAHDAVRLIDRPLPAGSRHPRAHPPRRRSGSAVRTQDPRAQRRCGWRCAVGDGGGRGVQPRRLARARLRSTSSPSGCTSPRWVCGSAVLWPC